MPWWIFTALAAGMGITTLLVLAVAITFGSFSVYKALGGGTPNVGRTERSEVPEVAVKNHERHETHEKTAVTESASAASLSCRSSISWLPTSTASPVKTTLTPIEQIQVGDRVLAESPTGEEGIAFGSEIIPSDWRKPTLWAPKRDGTVAEFLLLSPLMWLKRKIVCIQSATEPDDYGDANSMRPEIVRSEKCSVNRTSPMASNALANDDVA